MSVAPPGGNGTISLTGLWGYCGKAIPGMKTRAASARTLELRDTTGSDRILGVELAEVEVRALALLRRHAVRRREQAQLGPHVAEAGRVEPQADQAALALGLGEVLELRARVHDGVIVDDQHLAALEEEREPILRRLGDLVEEIERRDVFLGERDAACLVASHNSAALIATTQMRLFC